MAIFDAAMRARPAVDLGPILRNVGRHIRLTPRETEHFASLLKARSVRKGELLFQAGTVATHQLYVLHGCLRSYSVDEKGGEHVLQFAPEDWWIGDLGSFSNGTPAITFTDALENGTVLRMDRSDMDELYARVPKFERFFRILITNAFVAMQRRLLSVISLPAEERYREFIALYPKLEGRVPQKQIASYLGMTPEFLSTVRKRAMAKDAVSGKPKPGSTGR